jgi:hypothetical protein
MRTPASRASSPPPAPRCVRAAACCLLHGCVLLACASVWLGSGYAAEASTRARCMLADAPLGLQELPVGAPLALLCEEEGDVAALAAAVYPPEARVCSAACVCALETCMSALRLLRRARPTQRSRCGRPSWRPPTRRRRAAATELLAWPGFAAFIAISLRAGHARSHCCHTPLARVCRP